MEKINKTLWMRNVDWNCILLLLNLVNENNGLLRPIALENLALDMNLFVARSSGKQLAHSPRFYYRKVLENLGLVCNKNGRYFTSKRSEIQTLVSASDNKISSQVASVIANIIVENSDCRKYFMDVFSIKDDYSYTLATLRRKSWYAIAKTSELPLQKASKSTKNYKSKLIVSADGSKQVDINTPDKTQAIFWGIRQWLLDLEIIDEIILTKEQGRIIYVINPSINNSRLMHAFGEFMRKVPSHNNDWVTIDIPTFIRYLVTDSELRPAVSTIKEFLLNLLRQYMASVVAVPISGFMLKLKIPFEKQESAYMKCYLASSELGYISHLRVNKHLIGEFVK